MSTSINTNIAAYFAQANITAASTAAQSSVARLSSGNAIVNASDNVAALATGTSLATQVNALKTAQTNASQGSSLLQVADGALAQIQGILQQQQSLALQAGSGSLTNTDRAFLNQQFQALSNEIDALAEGTTFNGVGLIDGSISGGTSINTNTTAGSTTIPASATIATFGGNAVSGDTYTIKVAGQPAQTFTFGTATGNVGVGAIAVDSAKNLAAALNNSGLSQLADFRFQVSGTSVKAYYTGSATSISNIPALTSSTTSSTFTATATPTFTAATQIGSISGIVSANDTITIGSHVVTFKASGTNVATGYNTSSAQADIGLSTDTNGVTGTAVDHLVSYLNSVVGTTGFEDLQGITFSTDSTHTVLNAAYSGIGSTQPTLSTTFVSNSSNTLNGSTNRTILAPSAILTLPDNRAIINGGTTITGIGGTTITFGLAASGTTTSTATLVGDNTAGTALTNLVTYLNGTTVNAGLTGSLAGAVFSTDGTSLFASNTSTTGVAYSVTAAISNTGPSDATLNSGALATQRQTLLTAASGAAVSFANGDTVTLDGNVFTAGTEFAIGVDNTATLANLATYLNSTAGQTDLNSGNGGAANLFGQVFSSDTTHLYVTNPTAATTAAITVSNNTGITDTSGNVVTHVGTHTLLTSTLAGHQNYANTDTITIAGVAIALDGAAGRPDGATDDAHVLFGLATYLNSDAGQTLLAGSALAGARFSTDGNNATSTHLYVTNTTGATSVSFISDVTGTGGDAGSVTATNYGSGLAAGARSTLLTFGSSTATTLDTGDTITLDGNVLTAGTQFAIGGSNSASLTNLAAYLNSDTGQTALGNGSLGGAANLVGTYFATDGTHLYAINPNNTTDTAAISVAHSVAGTASGDINNTSGTTILSARQSLIGTATNLFSDGTALRVTVGGTATTIPNTVIGSLAKGADIAIGASNAATLTNIAAYLNSTAGQAALTSAGASSLLASNGVTFGSTATSLYIVNSGSNIAANNATVSFLAGTPTNPTLSAGSLGTPTIAGTFGGSAAALTSGSVLTVGTNTNNVGTAVISASTTFTIGGNTITFGTAAEVADGDAKVTLGTNNLVTLTNLAAYLNGSTVNAALGNNYAGFSFTTDGTHLIAHNDTGSSVLPGANTTFGAGAATPTGAVGYTAASIANGATANVLTLGIDTLVFGTAGEVSSGAANVLAGASLSASLDNAITYLNSNIPASSNVVFSHNSTQLLAQNTNGTTSAITSALTSTSSTFTGVTGQIITATSVVGLGAGVTSAQGTPGGSLFVNSTGTSVTNYGNAVDLSLVANNASFIGKFGGTGSIGGITGHYVNTGVTSTSGIQFSVKVGNDTYTTSTITNAALSSTTAPVTLLFTGSNTITSAVEGGSFTLTLQPQSNVTSQNQADQLATGINASLASVSAYQNRNVLSFNNNYSAEVSGTQIATLAGASLAFNSSDFTDAAISSVSVSAPSTGSTDAKIAAVVNGQTFSTVSGIGDTFSASNEIVLVNQSNPSQTLTLTLGTAGSADLSNASNAAAFQSALSSALGLDNANGGLSFQLGSTASANVSVTIGSAKVNALFGGASLNISTQSGASAAATVVAEAIDNVTSLRAGVGALESQFNFAAAALQTSVQNQDAARGALLDTDIATESTAYATSQVKLQAGISVLAQANQSLQALLKLIG